MRSATLLSLLIVLAFSDGADCQNFKTFKEKHIIPANLKTKIKNDWNTYLVKKNLCGREPQQSFIKGTEDDIKQICNGSGKNDGNYTKSNTFFEVYCVESSKEIKKNKEKKGRCNITGCTSGTYHVTVKCEKNLPVHYAFVTQPGFATPKTPAISSRPVNRLSRKRRRVAINSTPAEPPVPRQNLPLQASQPVGKCESVESVDFYTEDALGGDATETWNSVLAELWETILTNNREVVTSSGAQGATATECITVPAKSSVDLPSNQDHFNHELLLGISEKLGQVQENLNIHSEIARRMYGCLDT
ncbi:hypothetical protein E1301_Tti015540 [Triplophysa tibetana]|uniref:Ribonuclease A-domain domain-containing protein n=1 Tax=Triplophysa tibetana TaxID=1572043 RepID=A0A5A9N0P9_9TELE|nr:hypothetical protein E1301_Tti015540 [Triplophysa tibetana]